MWRFQFAHAPAPEHTKTEAAALGTRLAHADDIIVSISSALLSKDQKSIYLLLPPLAEGEDALS